ncbi:FRIGIDA-like protein 1 [Forsythia ovata]|uniref:FRIGIDA-like protein 1 n=1 Tax=Forsythia ovata TaxID=205694 RepID=A0ABD1QA63_9LAMI
MDLTTVQSISTALNLIDTKKGNLKRAFQELQSHSSSLTSFTFTWSDLNSYFTSIQSDLILEFSTLQSLESSRTPKPKPKKQKDSCGSDLVPARPELKCLLSGPKKGLRFMLSWLTRLKTRQTRV